LLLLNIGFTAHGGLQGTTKPTHYFVVHEEIGFKADELQNLTNTVSYMFARATKAVSLVSPWAWSRWIWNKWDWGGDCEERRPWREA
jgi:hypothetical protein